jgi:hypothetical protein
VLIAHKFVLFVAVLAAAAGAQDVGVLNLSPLHLTLPPTWSFDGSKRPIEGQGPDGEKVLISVLHRRADAQGKAAQPAQDLAKDFANGLMKDLAAKGGKVVIRPVVELQASPGKAVFSAASEVQGAFGRKSYFIQYVLAGSDVMFYFTFEGRGEAALAMARFDLFFDTQRWDE